MIQRRLRRVVACGKREDPCWAWLQFGSGCLRRVSVGRRQKKDGQIARRVCRRRQAWCPWRAGWRRRLRLMSVALVLVLSSSVEGVGLDGMNGMFRRIGIEGCLSSVTREFSL